tara:strand:- start:286 stop:657 length:372 start_codon:yes stop_codon:yes gene_type:complete
MLLPNRDENGRPNHIEVALANMHTGAWYMWTDNSNRIYANLILKPKIWIDGSLVDNPYSKPTEKECTDKLKEIQDAWDLENNSYKSERRAEYPSIVDQLDDIYHNGIDGWKATIKTTKDKFPK